MRPGAASRAGIRRKNIAQESQCTSKHNLTPGSFQQILGSVVRMSTLGKKRPNLGLSEASQSWHHHPCETWGKCVRLRFMSTHDHTSSRANVLMCSSIT